jgi:predicted NUDIX family NTP pyrophosphohydrolase
MATMTEAASRSRVSAGILLFRITEDGVEILLGHPGGPYFEGKDIGAWTIPKGQVEEGEKLLAVAKREFGEETGHVIGSNARLIELGSVKQRGGKTVFAWAVEGDLDPGRASSNTFRMEWPPRSGIHIEVPEIDQVAWFTPAQARIAMNPGQVPLVELLLQALDELSADE